MSTRPIARSRVTLPSRLAHLFAPSRILGAAALSRSRKGLTRLDDHLLKDIGLTREEAEAEASRRIWDAPPHWKC